MDDFFPPPQFLFCFIISICFFIFMTIPFRCASRYKQEMKRVCTVRSMVKFDIIYLREQAHYRARRGE